jgi:hypothetical protein
MLKAFMRHAAVATAVLGMLFVGALGTAAEASAAPQILTYAGLFRTYTCETMAGIHKLSGKVAYCVSLGNGYSKLYQDM